MRTVSTCVFEQRHENESEIIAIISSAKNKGLITKD